MTYSGRKRGRPVVLTPEQRLKNERERWRRKKAAKRKRDADAKGTGYFAALWVPHYYELIEALVGTGWLDVDDVDIPSRVDAAVDDYFARVIDLEFNKSGGRSRKFRRGEPRIIRVRMTQELADKLAAAEQGVFRGHYRADPDVIVESHKVGAEIRELRAALLVYRDAKRAADLRAAEARYADLESRTWVLATPQTVEPITDRKTLERIAERALYGFYSNYVPDPTEFPCSCKLALPAWGMNIAIASAATIARTPQANTSLGSIAGRG